MKTSQKALSILLAVIMLLSIVPLADLGMKANAYSSTSLAAMKERAEAIINYQWTPSQDIATWNGNSYNGRTYFKKGETVKGVPYTLFTTEVVSFSLLSLAQYKSKASANYSATAYCVSTSATRTGPVYGSCCADFICEVFGGNFMNGNNMLYHNVKAIKNSSYGTTTYNVKASNIKVGDAVSNTAGTHIVWIGEVTDSYFMIYEQTPPVAKKTKVYKSSSINSNGYLVFGGSVYNIVTRSKALSGESSSTHTVNTSYGKDFTAYLKSPETNHYVFDSNHNSTGSYVNASDPCTIHEVYTDGCCKFTFILDNGNTRTAYGKIEWFNSHTHSYTSKVTKAATCTAGGIRTYTCSCGDSYTMPIAPLNHDYTGQKVYQSGHPHEISQRCTRYDTCGGYKWTGENYSLKTCSQCWKATWTLSQSSISVKVGESKSISAKITGVFPDGKYMFAESDKDLFDLTVGNQTLTVTGKKAGSGSIRMYIYSDSNKTTLISSKTIPVTITQEATYTLSFNANGGSGAPSSISGSKIYTIPSPEPTRPGYFFIGWSKSSSASSATYKTGDAITLTSNTTLYAVWKKVFYGDVNGDSKITAADLAFLATLISGSGVTSLNKLKGDLDGDEKLTSADRDLLSKFLSGYTTEFPVEKLFSSFIVENSGKSTYSAGEAITGIKAYVVYSNNNYHVVTDGLTVTPAYASGSGQQKVTVSLGDWSSSFNITVDNTTSYSLSYNANGGSGAPSSESGSKSYTVSSTIPTKKGYTFLGWATSSFASSATYKPGNTINLTANTTLYAVWKQASSVSVGTTYNTTINFANQEYYYIFTPSSNVKYTFESSGSLDTRVYVYNSSWEQLGYNDDDGTDNNFKLTISLTSGTKYYVKVRAYSSRTGSTSFKITADTHTHSYTSTVTKAASCTVDGIRTYTCSGCSDSYTSVIAATGHSWNTASCSSPKTCTKCGTTSGNVPGHTYTNSCDTTCNVCSATRSVSHSYNSATCTSPKTCSVCGITSGSALGHTYSSSCDSTCNRCNTIRSTNHSYTEATCTTAATCKICGETSGSALGHIYSSACEILCSRCKSLRDVTHTYAPATCTEPKTCMVCGGVTSGEPLGHIYTNSCDSTCNRCSATRTAAHSYKTTTTKATLTTNGSVKTVCTDCGAVKSTKTVSYPKTFSLSATSLTYNGKVRTPSVTVKDANGKVLTKGTDYTVIYASGRKNVGTYKVTVKMIGNYSGTKTLSFKIKPVDISKCTVKLSATSLTYNGKVRTPIVSIVNPNGAKLTKDTHYTVTYASGRKNVGTYNVKVTMKGNYTGTKTLSFKIKPIDISKCTVKLSATSLTYNGEIRTPEVSVTNSYGTKLKTTNYTVTYASGRKNVGTYKVTVKMKGNYTGTKTLTFKILPPKTTISKLTAGAKKITVNLTKKTTQVTGYQLQYSTSKDFTNAKTKLITSNSTLKTTLSGLTANKTYYVRVRTYKTVNDVKYYSGWSAYKYVKTK